MLRGSCLCAALRYQVQGTIRQASHCHCGMCRKAHGAAFASYGRVRDADFRWLGEPTTLASYRASPGAVRGFCRACGSNISWREDTAQDYFELALGTLDDDPVGRPDRHIYVASKAPWYAITDTLPQHPENWAWRRDE